MNTYGYALVIGLAIAVTSLQAADNTPVVDAQYLAEFWAEYARLLEEQAAQQAAQQEAQQRKIELAGLLAVESKSPLGSSDSENE